MSVFLLQMALSFLQQSYKNSHELLSFWNLMERELSILVGQLIVYLQAVGGSIKVLDLVVSFDALLLFNNFLISWLFCSIYSFNFFISLISHSQLSFSYSITFSYLIYNSVGKFDLVQGILIPTLPLLTCMKVTVGLVQIKGVVCRLVMKGVGLQLMCTDLLGELIFDQVWMWIGVYDGIWMMGDACTLGEMCCEDWRQVRCQLLFSIFWLLYSLFYLFVLPFLPPNSICTLFLGLTLPFRVSQAQVGWLVLVMNAVWLSFFMGETNLILVLELNLGERVQIKGCGMVLLWKSMGTTVTFLQGLGCLQRGDLRMLFMFCGI